MKRWFAASFFFFLCGNVAAAAPPPQYKIVTASERGTYIVLGRDLAAQIASCRIGERRLNEIVAKYGAGEVRRYGRYLLEYSEAMTRAATKRLASWLGAELGEWPRVRLAKRS